MKKKILIISIIVLVITLIGSTYAFFMYSKTTKAFTLTSGDIQIQFVNGENNINLNYAYPISDNYAKANLEKLGYVDFSVNGNITEDKKVINYEIYLEEDSKNTLDSNYIKVYLTDDTNKEIVSPMTFNSLDKTSYANSENGKVIYKVSKKGEFNDKYRIYVWIDSSYSQNVIQERFSFKVNLYAYNDNETAVSVIKSNLVKYEESSKDTFTGGLVAVNTDGELYDETDSSESIREYRYSGPNVNNYVTFNDETWRIIGVFTDEKGEEHVKIVRNEELNGIFPETYTINRTEYKFSNKTSSFVYFNTKINDETSNDWKTSAVQYFLNTEKDNSENRGYLSYLSSDPKSMIATVSLKIGNFDYFFSPKQYYESERNSDNIWNGDIEVMYPSDYGYSAHSKYWDTQMNLYGFTGDVLNTTWLQKNANHVNNEWLLIPDTAVLEDRNSYWHIVGEVSSNAALNSVRPCLYLKSNVKITSGDGSQDNQYKLSLD